LAEIIVGKDITLSQAGQGIAQLLPILVAFLVVQPGQTVIVEHPEGALHPRTIRALAKLIPFVLDRGAQLVFETHSDLFLITIQEQVARGRIRHEDVILHWTLRDEGGATKLFSSMLDTRGDWCDDFPADFEDIRMDVVSSYLKATFKI
jgi:predicted ATPase